LNKFRRFTTAELVKPVVGGSDFSGSDTKRISDFWDICQQVSICEEDRMKRIREQRLRIEVVVHEFDRRIVLEEMLILTGLFFEICQFSPSAEQGRQTLVGP
jgi:hypothetical protein